MTEYRELQGKANCVTLPSRVHFPSALILPDVIQKFRNIAIFETVSIRSFIQDLCVSLWSV